MARQPLVPALPAVRVEGQIEGSKVFESLILFLTPKVTSLKPPASFSLPFPLSPPSPFPINEQLRGRLTAAHLVNCQGWGENPCLGICGVRTRLGRNSHVVCCSTLMRTI